MPVKLVEVTRGNTVESVHKGDIAVVDSKGELLYKLGDPEKLTYFRSASKPFQAVASLFAGIVESYALDSREIALLTSSHSGEKEHISVLRSIMQKTGIMEKQIMCGSHEPVNRDAAKELTALGQKPSSLHCNCSAKHVGILAACKLKGYEIDGYTNIEHPIQQDIDSVISDFTGIAPSQIVKGIDGCSIPVHAVPLKNIAYAYANLSNLKYMKGKYEKSQKFVTNSMTAYPEMVAGHGRLDTEIMKLLKGRVTAKIGAEGVYCVSIIGKNTGISLKIEDGNSRAVGPVILEILFQLNIIEQEELYALKAFWNPDILNHNDEKVGEIRASFKLKQI